MATNANPLGIFSEALRTQLPPFNLTQAMDTHALAQQQQGELAARAESLRQAAAGQSIENQKQQIQLQLEQQRRDEAKNFSKQVPSTAPPSNFPAPPVTGTDDEGNPIYGQAPPYQAAQLQASNPVHHFDWDGYAGRLMAKGDPEGAITASKTAAELRKQDAENAKRELDNFEAQRSARADILGGIAKAADTDPAQAKQMWDSLSPEDRQRAGIPAGLPFDLNTVKLKHQQALGYAGAVQQVKDSLGIEATKAEMGLKTTQAKEAEARTELYGEQAAAAKAARITAEQFMQNPGAILGPGGAIDKLDIPDNQKSALKNQLSVTWALPGMTPQQKAEKVNAEIDKAVEAETQLRRQTDPRMIAFDAQKARTNARAGALGQMDAIESMPENPTARAVAEYRTAPPSPRSLTTPAGQAFMAEVLKVNPSYDSTNYQNRQKTRVAYTTGQQGQQGIQLNTMIGHVDDAIDAAAAMGNGSFVPGNALWNKVRSAFGSDAVTNFDTFKTAVAGETAKVMKGVATDAEVKSVEHNISSASSPAQLQTALKDTMRIAGSKLRGLEYNYSQAFPEDKTFSILSPESKATLSKRGFDPATMRPGATSGGRIAVTAPNGRAYYFDSQDKADAFKKAAGIK